MPQPQPDFTPPLSPIAMLRAWAKGRKTPLARMAYNTAIWSRYANIPVIPVVHRALYSVHTSVGWFIAIITRIFWYTPMFQSRLETTARRLYLYGGMPFIMGPVRIRLGDRCRVAGKMSILGRSNAEMEPLLDVGDNVDLGWDSNIAVGRRIIIGNNVRLAMGTFLLGYPGHPIDAVARARGDTDTDDQVGDIIIEDDVWLGSRSTVLGGVRIGRGTIVAAGSVVTKDLPPFVLAGGIPAVIKKQLPRPADDASAANDHAPPVSKPRLHSTDDAA